MDFIECFRVLYQSILDYNNKQEEKEHIEEVPDLHAFTLDHEVKLMRLYLTEVFLLVKSVLELIIVLISIVLVLHDAV